ncbi:hypothetical protein GGI59_006338 [Rhizobium lentis]|uniref:Uncharacterized protein n=1 Tax=Rhizobium lentis TaxID=1138194 RepID=A0A7W9CYI4_9HYPH|nr:hypothetical protein [Rhizobium lentis]MBB5554012.1 hypothetical protein [Rhizobium lentis]MBB5564629.1 hypothetical protein [Rhizobium lentis]MBB5571125.1 hypothetical protein [Rhizobium lentis]
MTYSRRVSIGVQNSPLIGIQFLDADYPAKGVKIARRNTLKRVLPYGNGTFPELVVGHRLTCAINRNRAVIWSGHATQHGRCRPSRSANSSILLSYASSTNDYSRGKEALH